LAPLITTRYKAFTSVLNASDTDVLCFQEVTTYYHLHLLKKHLTNYPYHVYQKFVYGPKGGLAIFSKVPIESKRYDSFASLGSLTMYTQLLRNGVLSCKLKNLPVRILNTHLITDFEYEASKTNKYYPYVHQQIKETGVLMNTLAETGDTVITAGDFNLAKYDPTYKEFLKDTGALDVFAKETKPTYFHDRLQWHYHATKSVRIDYIFLRDKYDRIQITSTEHAFTEKVQLTTNKKDYLSDHIGLLTKFSIRK
jgi:endonuclease/exonuclease/phosphatase family metal-dependent hydrolase